MARFYRLARDHLGSFRGRSLYGCCPVHLQGWPIVSLAFGLRHSLMPLQLAHCMFSHQKQRPGS